MSIIELLLIIVIVGVILWVVNTVVPMAQPIKTILNAVVVIVLLLWILEAFGLIGGYHVGTVGRLR